MRIGESERTLLEAVAVILLIVSIRAVANGTSDFDLRWNSLGLLLVCAIGIVILFCGRAMRGERMGLIAAALWIANPAQLNSHLSLQYPFGVALLVFGVAMLLDASAIWFARQTKEKPGNELLLTRPLITRNAILLTSIAVTLEVGLTILFR